MKKLAKKERPSLTWKINSDVDFDVRAYHRPLIGRSAFHVPQSHREKAFLADHKNSVLVACRLEIIFRFVQ